MPPIKSRIPAFILLCPLIAHDLLTVSNRFAGPMVRFPRHLSALAAGQPVGPLTIREGDYWQELAEEFNRLRDEVEALRAAAGEYDDSPRRTSASLDEIPSRAAS